MGKSAKFYKRPSKKEKESGAIKKIVDPGAISKKDANKKISMPTSLFTKQVSKKKDDDEDVDMTPIETTKPEKKEKKQKEEELPDYVDLFSGKKTYKKVPKKRK